MQLKPLKTEKSSHQAALGRYVFAVEPAATKPQIKRGVEKLFGVQVVKVQTAIMPGKAYRTGRKSQKATRSDWKKATLTVKSGQKIDLFEAKV